MSLLVEPPRRAAEIARDVAGAYFARRPQRRAIEITSMAIPIYRFRTADDPFESLDDLDYQAWMFLAYRENRIVAAVEVARNRDAEPTLSGIDIANEGDELQRTIDIVDDHVDKKGFTEVRALEEPSLNSFFFWLRGPKDLFVDRFLSDVFDVNELRERMFLRRNKIIGGIAPPSPPGVIG